MEVRAKMTARGKIAFVTIDDGSQPRELTVYSELFDKERGKIVVDEVLVVEAKVSNDEFSGGFRIVVERLLTLGEARARFGRGCRSGSTAKLPRAAGRSRRSIGCSRCCRPSRRRLPVRVRYRNAEAEAELPLGQGWRSVRRTRCSRACVNGWRLRPWK